MLLRGKTKERSKERSSTRKVTPPSPSYMNNEQFAAYLASLRDTRNSRPGGARPQPGSSGSSASSPTRRESDHILPGHPSINGVSVKSGASPPHARTESGNIRTRAIRPSISGSVAGSVSSRYSTITSGRDYFPEAPAVMPLKPGEVVPSATYMERGSRWMEKEEAFSLRTAMEDMDIKESSERSAKDEKETRLYNAALEQAAELVWRHQKGVKPPESGTPYRYKPHMRKDSYVHARTASVGRYGGDIVPTGLARDNARSVSGSSSGSERRPSSESARSSVDGQRKTSSGSTQSKPYGSLSGNGAREPSGGRRRSSMKRNISGDIQKPFSGDQIYEEPGGDTPKPKDDSYAKTAEVAPLKLKLKNPLNKVQFAPDPSQDMDKSPVSTPTGFAKPFVRVEIHRNPPSRSRDPDYTSNSHQRPMGPRENNESPKKNGMEVRSDDIRQATSFKLGDRSRKLPTPSAVSDRPGRPIVSFDANWKAPEEAATDIKPEPKEPSRFAAGAHQSQQKDRQSQPQPQSPVLNISFTPDLPSPASKNQRPSTSSTLSFPSIQIDVPDVPAIAVTADNGPSVPAIVLPEEDNGTSVPAIVTPDDENKTCNSKSPARPLPTPVKASPFARNARGGARLRGHWSPAPGVVSRSTATCHECSFPIEGRFVALNGSPERFHPQCFACYTCGTSLEALEISPEPDSYRNERLDRIARRAAGEVLEEAPGKTTAEDGDSRLRFYCHLDWHELFAPRCKHCTTPILGDHIVALGHHFHYGHFFCAECGDPFEQGMTHIEKDGYAWCVNCQTKRTERRAPKCNMCKKPVIGQYIKALGGEWHDECFRCATCGGGFDDGQIFPLVDKVLCTGCRMRELKA